MAGSCGECFVKVASGGGGLRLRKWRRTFFPLALAALGMTARTGPHGIEACGVFAGFAAIGGLRRGEAMTLRVPAILRVAYRRRCVGIRHFVEERSPCSAAEWYHKSPAR
jgi:hypothetical protein